MKMSLCRAYRDLDWKNDQIIKYLSKWKKCAFKGKNKKNTTKDGEAIPYLPLDVSDANCTNLILVVNSLYI